MDIQINGLRRHNNNILPLGNLYDRESRNNIKTNKTYQSLGRCNVRPGKRIFNNDETMKGWIHSHLISDTAIIP